MNTKNVKYKNVYIKKKKKISKYQLVARGWGWISQYVHIELGLMPLWKVYVCLCAFVKLTI